MSRPLLPETFRRAIHIVDLVNSDALICQMQNFVVEVGINITLGTHHFLNTFITPTRPAVRRKHHFSFNPKAIESFVDLLRPFQSITNQGSAQSVDIVDCTGYVLCCPESFPFRKIRVHLGRSFCARSVLEDHFHPVKCQIFEILFNDFCRRDKP